MEMPSLPSSNQTKLVPINSTTFVQVCAATCFVCGALALKTLMKDKRSKGQINQPSDD